MLRLLQSHRKLRSPMISGSFVRDCIDVVKPFDVIRLRARKKTNSMPSKRLHDLYWCFIASSDKSCYVSQFHNVCMLSRKRKELPSDSTALVPLRNIRTGLSPIVYGVCSEPI